MFAEEDETIQHLFQLCYVMWHLFSTTTVGVRINSIIKDVILGPLMLCTTKHRHRLWKCQLFTMWRMLWLILDSRNEVVFTSRTMDAEYLELDIFSDVEVRIWSCGSPFHLCMKKLKPARAFIFLNCNIWRLSMLRAASPQPHYTRLKHCAQQGGTAHSGCLDPLRIAFQPCGYGGWFPNMGGWRLKIYLVVVVIPLRWLTHKVKIQNTIMHKHNNPNLIKIMIVYLMIKYS